MHCGQSAPSSYFKQDRHGRAHRCGSFAWLIDTVGHAGRVGGKSDRGLPHSKTWRKIALLSATRSVVRQLSAAFPLDGSQHPTFLTAPFCLATGTGFVLM